MNIKTNNYIKINDIYLLLSTLVLFAITFLSLPYGTGDTAELVNSSLALKNCLSDGIFNGCADMERFGFTPHLITLFLWSIFKDVASTISAWSLLNYILFSIIIYYFYKKSSVNKFFKISVLVFSPMIAYATYSFSEMTFIFMIFILLLSLKEDKFLLSLIISIFASAFKESSFILIAALIIASIINKKDKLNLKNISLISSSIAGLALVYIFNFYKYKQFVNDEYQTAGRVKEIDLIVSNFFGLIFSPSGGILGYFWISIVIAIIYFLLKNKDSKVSIILGLTFLVNYIVLTFWFAPFGWVTYGPRLIMPTIVALFLFILIFYPEFKFQFNFFIRFIIVLGNLLSSFSVLGFLINSDAFKNWLEKIIYNLPNCPKLYVWEIERVQYIQCFKSMTWETNSLPFLTLNNFANKVFDINNFNLLSVLLIIFVISFVVRNLIYLIKNR